MPDLIDLSAYQFKNKYQEEKIKWQTQKEQTMVQT